MRGFTNEQRVLSGVVITIAAGRSEVINVTGTGGYVVFGAAGATGTKLKCTSDGTAALGQSAAAVTLGSVEAVESCFVKITNTHGSEALQVHVI